MSIDKKYLGTLKKHFLSYAEKRRDVIKMSDDALHQAKRAIFAMHRDDMKEAKEKLAESEKGFKALSKKYKNDKQVQGEGAFRAGLEEYVEAALFMQFLEHGKIGMVKVLGVDISAESYAAGLCDVPGELYRYAIKSATNRDIEMVKKCADVAQEITGELIEFNLTKYLRNKFDQAKSAVQKLENVVYEVSLRE